MSRSPRRPGVVARLALFVWALSALLPAGGLELCLGCEDGPFGPASLGYGALASACVCHDDAHADEGTSRAVERAADRRGHTGIETHGCRDVALATPVATRDREERHAVRLAASADPLAVPPGAVGPAAAPPVLRPAVRGRPPAGPPRAVADFVTLRLRI